MIAGKTWRRYLVLAFIILLVTPISSVSALETAFISSGGLTFSTFLGSSDGADEVWDVATDAAGNIYVIGETFSANFPVTAGAYDTTYNNGYDVFVAKLNAGGSQLIWATYLGGVTYEYSRAIAVDSSGVYVVGQTTSTDFPVTSGAYDTSYNGGGYDAFISKLSLDGRTLIWSTYLGGGENQLPIPSDYPHDIAVDSAGNVYITGWTESNDFPTTGGAYDGDLSGNSDAFLSKVKADGSALLYSTYLGGSSSDNARGVVVDKSNQAYVTGRTYSADFPTTAGSYDISHNGGHDAYVTKFKADGSGLVYSTFIGNGRLG